MQSLFYLSLLRKGTSLYILILYWYYFQVTKLQNLKANIVCGSAPELRRTSSFDRTWEENVAETVANELVLHAHSSSISSTRSGPLTSALEYPEDSSRSKLKDSKTIKSGRPSHEEKKFGKSQEEKRTRARKLREFHNIKISQVFSCQIIISIPEFNKICPNVLKMTL